MHLHGVFRKVVRFAVPRNWSGEAGSSTDKMTSQTTPTLPYESAFLAAVSFDTFLEQVEAHRDLWLGITARLPDLSVDAKTIRDRWQAAGSPVLRLLVLADDWCGDATNTVPILARLIEAAGCVALGIVSRDAAPEVMDRHLTNGGRAIPMVVLLDEDGNPLGQWGPRPTELQTRVQTEWKTLSPEDRYKEVRRWYARDRGRSTVAEVTELLEAAYR